MHARTCVHVPTYTHTHTHTHTHTRTRTHTHTHTHTCASCMHFFLCVLCCVFGQLVNQNNICYIWLLIYTHTHTHAHTHTHTHTHMRPVEFAVCTFFIWIVMMILTTVDSWKRLVFRCLQKTVAKIHVFCQSLTSVRSCGISVFQPEHHEPVQTWSWHVKEQTWDTTSGPHEYSQHSRFFCQ